MTSSHSFIFLAEGQAAPAGAIGVDSAIAGVALDLSHWQEGAVPASLTGDLGFEQAWLARQQGLLHDYQGAPLVNDHIDVDGLLAAAAIAWPEEAFEVFRPNVLRRAAATADFTEWYDIDALRLVLCLHELMEQERAHGGAWQQAVYDRMLDWRKVHADFVHPAPSVLNMLNHVQDRWRVITGGFLETTWCAGLAATWWENSLGHLTDVFCKTEWLDDVPLWLLDAVQPRASWQYTAWHQADGWCHLFEAPRYSWARTFTRPAIHSEPDWAALQYSLQEQEGDIVIWSREAGKNAAFTGRLGLVPGVFSQLSPEEVMAVWFQLQQRSVT